MPEDSLVRGYTDKLGYTAGERLTFYAAGPGGSADIALHRLTEPIRPDGGPPPLGPRVPWLADASHPLREQTSCVGSFMLSAELPATLGVDAFTIGAWVWCTQWATEEFQALISVGTTENTYVALGIRNGCATVVEASSGTTTTLVSGTRQLVANTWNVLTLSVSGGRATVRSAPRLKLYGDAEVAQGPAGSSAIDTTKGVTVAGVAGAVKSNKGVVVSGHALHLLTAKVSGPFLSNGPITTGDFDELASGQSLGTILPDREAVSWSLGPTQARASSEVDGTAPGRPAAILVNLPLRGVTGPAWDGTEHDYRHSSTHYDAVHFHNTDIGDVDWEPMFTSELPADLPSGLYGIKMTSSRGEDLVPVIVSPAPSARRNRVALILPTFTQLAYANETLFDFFDPSAITDKPVQVSERDRTRVGDHAYGRSMYETHDDGSGVALSSAARPIANYRPYDLYWLTVCPRHIAADLWIIQWLTRHDHAFDVLSDLDVHIRGNTLLREYDVVITGGHPEYVTGEMLDALTEFRDGGGGLMYLGGNGFYWVTGVLSVDPLVVEIRRGDSGIRAWQSEPGEEHLWSTGLKGGMWRQNGRHPQRLVGVGMCAQGWGRSEPYSINPDLPTDHWLLAGVTDTVIGSSGRSMGGAAGDELDRIDHALGTPPGARAIASSRNHTDYYQRVVEELPFLTNGCQGGSNDPAIHSDIVWFDVPGGGSVFSAGSIAYSGALLDDPGISQLTHNALSRMLDQHKDS